MSDSKITNEISSAIKSAVQEEVSKLQQKSVLAEVEAAQKGIVLDQPAADRRYVIYWTARQSALTAGMV